MQKKIEKLKEFYSLMFHSRDIKKEMLQQFISGKKIPKESLNELKNIRNLLRGIPKQDEKYLLKFGKNNTIKLDLTYEIKELEKDIIYVESGKDSFLDYLANIHKEFNEQVDLGCELLGKVEKLNFITDRDGTVNNYCGRYASSIQSIYNAMFLWEFACTRAKNSVILTSAPLEDIGLADISIFPPGYFIYAGAKGRKYIDMQGKRKQYLIKAERQAKLDIINKWLIDLTKKEEYEIYSLIGSGLQFKFGQTTIARQDIDNSISEEVSLAFLDLIRKTVREIDPGNEYFRIEDTGTDIEIILTIECDISDEGLKDFDKGDGVSFLDRDLGIGLADGPNLICGDTNSDVPMLEVACRETVDTYSIFVTKDAGLKNRVLETCNKALVVTEPDILITILHELSK